MNMLLNNSISSKSNAINRNRRFSQDVRKINLLNYRSIDIESEYFTNYTSLCMNKVNNRFFEIYDNVIIKGDNIERYCEGEELRGNGLNTKRLLNILNSYPGMIETDETLPNIIKYKNRQKDLRGLQFYLRENRMTNELDIVLIDLYHLGLPSEHQYTIHGGKVKSHPKQQYNKLHKKKHCCINDLINEFENSTESISEPNL